MDFVPTLDIVRPDILIVNAEGVNEDKRRLCEQRGMEYIVLERKPADGLEARSSSGLKKQLSAKEASERPSSDSQKTRICNIPTRVDRAGTWIDQPYISRFHPGWAITVSVLPTFEIRDFCGLSTSTRKAICRIWPLELPKMDPETTARLIFCFENAPERQNGFVSGAQDAIGICIPGLCRHYYNDHYWPEKIEICSESGVLWWLEQHLCLIPLAPRPKGCSVVEEKDITLPKVKALADASDRCWHAILAKNLDGFAAAYRDSFEAQTAMFPGMVTPAIIAEGENTPARKISLQPDIDRWSAEDGVLAWKLTGAGGGGYLAMVVRDTSEFMAAHPEATEIHIRRN